MADAAKCCCFVFAYFMPVKTFRPLTPSTRYITVASFDEITKDTPERSLISIRKKSGGRNHYGRVTARGIGKGHKQFLRNVDFKRHKHGIEAEVAAIEYDPIRTARLALLQYKDGEKMLIIAPGGIAGGGKIDERADGPAGSRATACRSRPFRSACRFIISKSLPAAAARWCARRAGRRC